MYGIFPLVWLVLIVSPSYPLPHHQQNEILKECPTCPEMVLVTGGTFTMGNAKGERDEKPEHQVSVNGFYMARFEISKQDWDKVIYETESSSSEGDLPALVSWESADLYAQKISELTGKKYRLPTEAEWEFAAKDGGKSNSLFAGSDNALEVVTPFGGKIGQKKPNKLGIHDLCGVAPEWCYDFYASDYYSESVSDNPKGHEQGLYKVVRGTVGKPVTFRNHHDPEAETAKIAIRLVRELE